MSVKASTIGIIVLFLLAFANSALPQQEQQSELMPAFDGIHSGFIDSTGKVVIPFRYDEVEAFSEGLAVVIVNDKCGYIDERGAWVVSPTYSRASDFSEGLAAVGKYLPNTGWRWGYINREGEVVIPIQFPSAEPFSEGLAVVSSMVEGPHRGIRYGYIGKNGDYVIPPRFVYAKSFSEGLAAAAEHEKHESPIIGYIDHAGKFMIPAQYDAASSFSEGLASVHWNKWGYINKTGDVAIDFSFDQAWEFRDGLAKVGVGGLYGFIDKKGLFAITPNYLEASAFSHGAAAVYGPRSGSGLIDRQGKMLVSYPLRRARNVGGGIFLIQHGVFGWTGYMDTKGTIIYKFPPDSLCRSRDCLFLAEEITKRREKIRFRSKPPGATIYLIPRWDYERNPDLLSDEQELEKYRFPNGLTPVECKQGCIFRQVYWAVFLLRGQKCKLLIDIVEGEDHDYFVGFDECADKTLQ